MKGIVVIGLLAVACASHASFELVLVADNGSGTNATRKIHRFDADSGVYLGSFGSFGSNITTTALNKATNSLYVQDGNIMSEWDYNTGRFKGTHPITLGPNHFAFRPDFQRLAAFTGDTSFITYTFPNSTGSGVMGFATGAQYRAGFWTQNTEIIAFDGGNRVFRRIAVNANADAGTVTASSAAYATGTFGQIARNAGAADLIMAAGSELRIVNTNTLSASALASPIGTTVAVASGHEGYFLASTGGVPATAVVTRYDRWRNFRGQFGSGILTSPTSVQAVLAPEPGTMIALGAGALALLRRRKKS